MNPIDDRTGAAAAQEQPADVWFLAGTYGGRAARACTMPSDRPLFVPVFNMWHTYPDGPPPVVERAFGHLDVDGSAHPTDVIFTPVPFVVAGVKGNAVTGKAKHIPMTVWGLWKRLEPLPIGSHRVAFTGGDGYGFEVAVEYRLDVVAR